MVMYYCVKWWSGSCFCYLLLTGNNRHKYILWSKGLNRYIQIYCISYAKYRKCDDHLCFTNKHKCFLRFHTGWDSRKWSQRLMTNKQKKGFKNDFYIKKKRMYMYSGIQSLRPLVKILLFCICSECKTISFITNDLKNVHKFQNILVFPPFTLMTSCTPAGMDSTSLLKTWWASLSQQDLTMFQRASCDVTESLAFSVFKCPINVQWGWGQVTVEESPWQSGLLGLLWSSSSSCKALRCVWGHYPAAVWILLHKDANQRVQHVSEEWTGTSAGCNQFSAGVQLQIRQNTPRLEYSHHHVSLLVWYTAVSFSLLFVSLHAPFC